MTWAKFSERRLKNNQLNSWHQLDNVGLNKMNNLRIKTCHCWKRKIISILNNQSYAWQLNCSLPPAKYTFLKTKDLTSFEAFVNCQTGGKIMQMAAAAMCMELFLHQQEPNMLASQTRTGMYNHATRSPMALSDQMRGVLGWWIVKNESNQRSEGKLRDSTMNQIVYS